MIRANRRKKRKTTFKCHKCHKTMHECDPFERDENYNRHCISCFKILMLEKQERLIRAIEAMNNKLPPLKSNNLFSADNINI